MVEFGEQLRRAREKTGLTQQTSLIVLPDGYTKNRKRMSEHRYLFRKFNYIVERGSNDVFYDEHTERRPMMEANAPNVAAPDSPEIT